jgi:surface antigen
MLPARFVVAAIMAAAVAGCASDSYSPKQDTGAVTGAVGGGAFGAVVGGRGTGNRVAGAANGAVAGGLAGSAIGASLDERDRQRAYAAEMQALENGSPGAPVGWRSEHTAYHGTVVPGPYYYSGGMRCRSYTHTVYIEGRPRAMRSTACRNPDGSWIAIG